MTETDEGSSLKRRCAFATLGCLFIIGIIIIIVLIAGSVWFYFGMLIQSLVGVIKPELGEKVPTLPTDVVPNVFEGEVRLANFTWEEQMENTSSSAFSSLANKFEAELEEFLGGKEFQPLKIIVRKLLPGSVMVR